jgi:hypothetical protein
MSVETVTSAATAQSSVAPAHDKDMAAAFLAALDPTAKTFTFQFFGDGTQGYAEVFHGSLDDVWLKVLALNTPGRGVGVFVTINETDGQGRRRENIVRARALFVDADSAAQLSSCIKTVRDSGARPTMIVQTSAERAHLYYCCDDIRRDQFTAYQTAMAQKFGTDPAVKDLPRVMRLPGTLHLKDPSAPRKVTLKISSSPRRWDISELSATLGLAGAQARGRNSANLGKVTPEVIPAANPATRLSVVDTPVEVNGVATRSAARVEPAGTKASEWYDRLPPGLKNQALDHALEVLATRTKYLELEKNGGSNLDYYRLMQACARSDAPGAEDLWVKWGSIAAGADPEEKLRADFARCSKASASVDGVTIGTPLGLAQQHGAIFDRWKRQAACVLALPPAERKPLKGGVYGADEALELLNSHYLIGKTHQETGIFRIKDDGSLAFIPPDQFKLDIGNIFVRPSGGSSKPISAEKFWKESPRRHQRGIVFKPGGTTEADEFNLWQGFGVVPRKGRRKMCSIWRHIRKVICRDDKAKFGYLMRWLAWTVQNPDSCPGVVLVLKSRKEGTGKSTLGIIMLKIFGPHGALIDDKDRLLGQFNDWLETVCFVLAEEVLWAGDHRTTDKLKSLITANTIRIERKFGSCRAIPNRLHVIMTTNHDHAVAAGVRDRRYFVLDVDDRHVGDKVYFGRLYQDLNDGGASEFLYLLQNWPLGDWHPRELLKTTEASEQQRMSGDSVSQWSQACINADAIAGGQWMPALGKRISSEELRDSYAYYCRKQGLRPANEEVFGKACTQMFGQRVRLPAREQWSHSLGKNVVDEKSRRPWGYDVPDGDEWQEKLDARLGINN